MANKNVTLKVGYTNEEWDTFVKGKLLLFMTENDIEKILFRKGIGFGKKTGDIINSGEKVEKIFTIEDKTNYDNFKQLINYADKEIIALSEEVIVMISNELSEELDEKIESYSNEEYHELANKWIDYTNIMCENLSDSKKKKLKDIFINSCLYEMKFWNMAYKIEGK